MQQYIEPAFDGLPKLQLSFDIGGESNWTLQSQTGAEASYTSPQGHTLSLKLEQTGIQQILRFILTAPAGEELAVSSYTAKALLPTKSSHSVMVPNTRILAHKLIYYHEHRVWPDYVPIYRCLVPEEFGEDAYANTEAPFILLTDDQGNNSFSIGWAIARIGSRLNGTPEGEAYALTLHRQNDVPFTGAQLEDALIISSAAEPWMDVEGAYVKTFDKMNGRTAAPAPAWAFEPVFCTWYCYEDHIDQEGVLKIARMCKDLGFGTILIDAGWDTEPGGWCDFDNGNLGDFVAAPNRFPDLPGAIKEMHDMGLKVELWSGSFWQGKKSHSYQEKTKDWHAWTDNGEDHSLCPKYPGTRQRFKDIFAWVAKTYGVDGMWLDTADGVPYVCKAEHEHLDQPMGDAFVECMSAIREGLRSVKPDAITEVRVLHGNLNSKTAFDVVQPSDAPESFEMLRLAGIHIRPWAQGIVFKNDPMMWPKDADAATVGKYLATMVCNGVPALSVDYLTATDEQRNLTKAWLSFYQEHKDTLINGDFRLFGADYAAPDMMIVRGDKAVVYLKNPKTTEVTLPEQVKTIILLNCSESDDVNLCISPAAGKYQLQTYRPDWTKTGQPVELESSGSISISHAVPQGGAAVIEAR